MAKRDDEKRQKIADLLARYDEDTYPGDRALADYLGVSNHLVYAVRTGHRRGSESARSAPRGMRSDDQGEQSGSWRDAWPLVAGGLALAGLVITGIMRASRAGILGG